LEGEVVQHLCFFFCLDDLEIKVIWREGVNPRLLGLEPPPEPWRAVQAAWKLG